MAKRDRGQARPARKRAQILDADHHDLEKVKDRILEFLAVRKLAPDAKARSSASSAARASARPRSGARSRARMGRKFARASLGGVRDEAEIRGHRRTYVGAMPGRILQSLRRAGSRNPVFLLDEIDKLGADFRGDPSSALLEVLDPEQNYSFSDHYLEVPFDLSRVLFIATANTLSTDPAGAARPHGGDRAPRLHREREARDRAQLPGAAAARGARARRPTQVSFDDARAREGGARVHARGRRAQSRPPDRDADAQGGARGRRGPRAPRASRRRRLRRRGLGAAAAPARDAPSAPRMPGVVVGLARTNHGGDILFIEATAMPGGKGVRLRLTGQLGDVMRESAEAALSWVRANAEALGLSDAGARAAGRSISTCRRAPCRRTARRPASRS